MAGTRTYRISRPCQKKVCFPTEQAAVEELNRVRRAASRHRDRLRHRRENRIFYCFPHRCWHLTSSRANRT